MSVYVAGQSKVPKNYHDSVFLDGEIVPIGIVVNELNSIAPLAEKLRKANERIAQLEKRGTKNERGLEKGMAKLNQRIAELMKVNSMLRADLAREQGHLC